MRFFIELGYFGKHFNGWQSQPNAIGVQSAIEKALSTLLREPTPIVGSGRTDTGVHCRKQYAHFDTHQTINTLEFCKRLNALVGNDIVIHNIKQVKEDAHARFDATKRSYEYYIIPTKNPFLKDFAWLFFKSLDVECMQQAAHLLLQHTDFEAFSKVHTDVKTFNCAISEAEWFFRGEQLVFRITANRFLRGMVRAIVGTLVEVGTHKKSIQDFENVIIEKNRNKAGMAAPPHGLFLIDVEYPSSIFV